MITHKICNKCSIDKPVSEFWKMHKKEKTFKYSVKGKSVYAPICKECGRIYRRTNPEYVRKTKIRIKEYQRKVKIEVFNHYSNEDIRCQCCNEKEIKFLCLDHIDGGGGEERKRLNGRGGVIFYAYLKAHKYPEGYQLLCFNCNGAKGIYGFCPHNNKQTNQVKEKK